VKIVLDTNVLVSGLMTRGGHSAVILDHIVKGDLVACLDDRMFEEYEQVCREPRLALDLEAVRDFLGFLRDAAERVVPRPLSAQMPDVDDLPFLEVATQCGAMLITGNRKHFPPTAIGHVVVVDPSGFMEIFRSRKV